MANFIISSDPPPIPPTKAYRYASDIYNQTRGDAQQFAENFAEGSDYPCWIEPRDGIEPVNYSVSMSPSHVGVTVSDRDMAVLATVFAVVASLALAAQISCVIISVYDPIYLLPAGHPIPGVVRAGLSREKIDEICRRATEDAKPVSGEQTRNGSDEDVCAICLEEDKLMPAKLMCGHIFHLQCVRGWLLRGGGNCPLCNMDLSKDPLPATTASEHGESSVPTEELALSSDMSTTESSRQMTAESCRCSSTGGCRENSFSGLRRRKSGVSDHFNRSETSLTLRKKNSGDAGASSSPGSASGIRKMGSGSGDPVEKD